MVEDFIYKYRKKIVIVGVLAILAILVVSIYNIIEKNINTAKVDITVAPLIAKVKIGGREYDATDTAMIRPGTYDVEIYADGFITKNVELTALANETVELSLYLDPTEENSDWYSENIADGTARGDIISDNLLQDFRDLQKKYPILNYVPYNTFTYAINYENGCIENNDELCLIIDANFGYRRYAVQYLQSKKQDLSDFYVKVKNQKLPFKRVELNVPESLSFEGEISGTNMSSADASEVARVANNYIKQSFDLGGYTAKVGQIKKYDNTFFGVILMVYSGDGSADYDIYRMIVGLVGGEYRVITNADVVLSKYKNPLVPEELLRLVDSF